MTQRDPGPLLLAAKQTNQERDAMDRSSGFATPGECPTPVHVAAIREALLAGIASSDWACVAEAACMLDDLAERFQ
jgi:hypothetical protein